MNEKHEKKTALITGASSGIGSVFARMLAEQGYNLVLIARRKDRLDRLAKTLRETHGVDAEVLVADLAKTEDVDRVVERIGGIDDLDMLINDAGFGTVGKFSQVDESRQVDMLNVHARSTLRLTHAALQGMIPRKSGNIINVSSLAGFAAFPGNANYCATKAYLVTFSKALAYELEGSGVRVQALCPGFTHTEFHDTAEFADFDKGKIPASLWMSAEDVVDASLKALRRNRVICIPGFANRLKAQVLRCRLCSWLLHALGLDKIK